MLKSIKAVSSLEKIFIDSDVSDLTELKHFSMLKNEKKSFQIALDITDSEFINIDISSSLNDFLNISVVKNVPSDLAAPKRTDNFYIKKYRDYIPIFYFLFPKAVLLTLQEPSPFGLKFHLAGKNFYRAATTI